MGSFSVLCAFGSILFFLVWIFLASIAGSQKRFYSILFWVPFSPCRQDCLKCLSFNAIWHAGKLELVALITSPNGIPLFFYEIPSMHFCVATSRSFYLLLKNWGNIRGTICWIDTQIKARQGCSAFLQSCKQRRAASCGTRTQVYWVQSWGSPTTLYLHINSRLL